MYYDEKTAARVCNALLAGSKNAAREGLKKAWIDAAGRMCVCDGFRAYRLNTPVAGVPDEDPEAGVNLDRIYPATLDGCKPLELPTLAEVRQLIAEDKRAKKTGEPVYAYGVYTFGTAEDGTLLPAVNLHYLADVLTLYPNALAYYDAEKSTIRPIIFEDENGDALILPVRPMDGQDWSRRRRPQGLPEKVTGPALGLRTFAALYAAQ